MVTIFMGTGTSLCDADELRSLTESSKFSEEEIATMYHRFLSENQDGRLRKKRFHHISKALGFDDEGFVDTVFKALCYEKSRNYLTFPDIVRALSIIERGSSMDKAIFAFGLFDAKLATKYELLAFMKRLKPIISDEDNDDYDNAVFQTLNELQFRGNPAKCNVDEFRNLILTSDSFTKTLKTNTP